MNKNTVRLIGILLVLSSSLYLYAAEPFVEFTGTVIDKSTRTPLAYAAITVPGTNLSTVTNSDGVFSIKVRKTEGEPEIHIQYMGFQSETLTLVDLTKKQNKIELVPITVELPEVSVISVDAEELMRSVFRKIPENYMTQATQMTAFFRESIKKNTTYVSLSEAVLDILKQPVVSYKDDVAKFYKARKKVDYNKLDTLIFKLMGGPYNSLNLDVAKHPDYIFTEQAFKNYDFTFEKSTRMNNQLVYVIAFSQNKSVTEPYYYGELYIDAQTLAIRSAVFNMNLVNKDAAADLFIVKKPQNAKVTPTVASYRIDYVVKDGLWYYNYSRIELGLKINWKRKLFNTNYFATIEMAVTDWNRPEDPKFFRTDKIKPSVIVSDEPIGFSDPEFWGDFNVIEPEKSIESAIRKIKRQLDKSY